MPSPDNSYSTELEFFHSLDRRLNADDFVYRSAIIEAGATEPLIIKFLNMGKGGTLLEIQAELDAYIAATNPTYEYSLDELTNAYNILSASETQTQIKAQQALILATSLIDSFEFVGAPTSSQQPLQWPRMSIVNRNGSTIPDYQIPSGIKQANNELAFYLLQFDLTSPAKENHLELLTSSKIGESTESYAANTNNKKLPDQVLNYMRPFLVEKSDYTAALIF